MYSIGDIQLNLVSDGILKADGGGMFGLVPRSSWSKITSPDDNNLVPMALHSLLIRAGGQTLVVDTGVGTRPDLIQRVWGGEIQRPYGGLLDGLARLGVAPEDVDVVIDTHLHGDHCSGNVRLEDGQLVPTFPNAEYVVQRVEYAEAAFPNERTRNTYFADNFKPLYEAGQMRLLDGDTEIVPGVRCVITRGHTRAHQSVVIQQGDESAIFVCDMASMSVHFERLAWVTAYDVEPLENIESKRTWRRWAAEHDALIIFPHDPFVPVARLQPKADRPDSFRLAPEPNPFGEFKST